MFKSLVAVAAAVLAAAQTASAESANFSYPEGWASEVVHTRTTSFTRVAPQHALGELVPLISVTAPEKLLGDKDDWFGRAIHRMEEGEIEQLEFMGEVAHDDKTISVADTAVRATDGTEHIARWFMVSDGDWATVVLARAESEKVMEPFSDQIAGIVKSVAFHGQPAPLPHTRVIVLPAPAPSPQPAPMPSSPAPHFPWPSRTSAPLPTPSPKPQAKPLPQPSQAHNTPGAKPGQKTPPPPPGKVPAKPKSAVLAKLGF